MPLIKSIDNSIFIDAILSSSHAKNVTKCCHADSCKNVSSTIPTVNHVY
jgi:hypothetical protein